MQNPTFPSIIQELSFLSIGLATAKFGWSLTKLPKVWGKLKDTIVPEVDEHLDRWRCWVLKASQHAMANAFRDMSREALPSKDLYPCLDIVLAERSAKVQ